jgi:hypothetical protein
MVSAMDDAITGARRPNLPSRITCGASAKEPSSRHFVIPARSSMSGARGIPVHLPATEPGFLGPVVGTDLSLCHARITGADEAGEREKSSGRKIKRSHRGAPNSRASARIPILPAARRRLGPNPSRRSANRSRRRASGPRSRPCAGSRSPKPPSRVYRGSVNLRLTTDRRSYPKEMGIGRPSGARRIRKWPQPTTNPPSLFPGPTSR